LNSRVENKIETLIEGAVFKDFENPNLEVSKPNEDKEHVQSTRQNNDATYTGVGLGALGAGLGGAALYNTLANDDQIRHQKYKINHLNTRFDANDSINRAQNASIKDASDLARDAGKNTENLYDYAEGNSGDLAPRVHLPDFTKSFDMANENIVKRLSKIGDSSDSDNWMDWLDY